MIKVIIITSMVSSPRNTSMIPIGTGITKTRCEPLAQKSGSGIQKTDLTGSSIIAITIQRMSMEKP